jgi:ribosome-associated heat shock protein Hsp15
MSEAQPKLRLDKWLWQARFFKTRSLAAKQISSGHVRVNGSRAGKPAHGVGLGDVLTFIQARDVRVVEIVALGERRGPAPEAQALYIDRTEKTEPPKTATTPQAHAPRFDGSGRRDKRQRRALGRIKRQEQE